MPSDELVRHVRKLGLRILGAPSLRWRRARLSVPVPTLDSRSFASSGYSSETLVVLTRLLAASRWPLHKYTVAAQLDLSRVCDSTWRLACRPPFGLMSAHSACYSHRNDHPVMGYATAALPLRTLLVPRGASLLPRSIRPRTSSAIGPKLFSISWFARSRALTWPLRLA
jgi:hypothetical protein